MALEGEEGGLVADISEASGTGDDNFNKNNVKLRRPRYLLAVKT